MNPQTPVQSCRWPCTDPGEEEATHQVISTPALERECRGA